MKHSTLATLTLLVLLLAIIFSLDLSYGLHHPLGSTDLVYFWVAGKLFVAGEPPYDATTYLAALQVQGLTFDQNSPPLVWNPPWVYTFIAPFAFFSLEFLSKLWLLATVSCFVFCARLSIRIFKKECGTNRTPTLLTHVALLSYFPFFLCLWLGQLTPIVLLATCLWLHLETSQDRNDRQCLFSGLLLSVTSIKPHLVSLLWIYAFARLIQHKQIAFVVGLVGGLALLNIIPACIRPTIFAEFFANLQEAPLYWKNPTLTSFLSRELAIESSALKLLPVGVAAVFVFWRSFRQDSQRLPFLAALLPLSIVVSPYGWVYDCILFLPTIVLGAGMSWLVAGLLIGMNLMMFCMPSYEMSAYFWFPVAMTLVAFYIPSAALRCRS